MRLSFGAPLGALLLALGATSAPAQLTLGSDAPDIGLAPFGKDVGAFTAIAQSFTTPAGASALTGFTFQLSDYIGGNGLNVRGSVFAFDAANGRTVGSALFTSLLRAASTNDGGYDALAFSGLNVALAPDATYAIVLWTDAEASWEGSTNFVGTTTGDTFAGGQLFTSVAASAEFGTSGAFVASSPTTYGRDAAVVAQFQLATVVPEPATVTLVGLGLAGLALGGVRRRR